MVEWTKHLPFFGPGRLTSCEVVGDKPLICHCRLNTSFSMAKLPRQMRKAARKPPSAPSANCRLSEPPIGVL
jgi:hypothetical protein